MRHSRPADLIIGRRAVSLENAFELSGTASAHRVHGLKGSRTPRFPRQLSVEIKRVIAEGDLVVTYDLVRGAPDDRGLAGIDIFRLQNGKIVEHWGIRQPVPESSANDNTMF